MTHDEIKSRLSEFLDGELPEGERRELSSHVARCSDCRGAAQDFRGVGRALFQPLPLSDSERFVRSVMSRLPEEAPAARAGFAWNFWWVPSLSLGFAALLAILALRRESPIGTETLLLADSGGSSPAEWAVVSSGGKADDLLRMSLEEP